MARSSVPLGRHAGTARTKNPTNSNRNTSGTRARSRSAGNSKSPSTSSRGRGGSNQDGPLSLGDRIYQELKHDIITGVFQSGEALTEKMLATRYRASRTPVREAAVRLQQENLLRIVPNRGYFVRHITLNELNDLYEYRAALEGACAELAARKGATAETLEELRTLGEVHFDRGDRDSYERFVISDTKFHILLAEIARNKILLQAVRDVRSQMERIMYAASDLDYYGESPSKEHAGVVDAIERREPDVARRLMQEHIFISKDKVLQLASNSRVL